MYTINTISENRQFNSIFNNICIPNKWIPWKIKSMANSSVLFHIRFLLSFLTVVMSLIASSWPYYVLNWFYAWQFITLWRHCIKAISALLALCEGNPTVNGPRHSGYMYADPSHVTWQGFTRGSSSMTLWYSLPVGLVEWARQVSSFIIWLWFLHLLWLHIFVSFAWHGCKMT